jgi:hypothetical protein
MALSNPSSNLRAAPFTKALRGLDFDYRASLKQQKKGAMLTGLLRHKGIFDSMREGYCLPLDKRNKEI